MSLFKKNISFEDFVHNLKTGTIDCLKDLNLKEDDFFTFPHGNIMDNPQDIAIGVNTVKIKNKLSLFSMFDVALIKYLDDGEVFYIFLTTTTDHKSINTFAETLFKVLGPGIYDSDRDYSFKHTERIKELAINTQSERKSIMNCWTGDKYTVTLQYDLEPLHQFVLRITKHVPKTINRQSRKGTILDLISLDLNKILIGNEIETDEIRHEDGSLNCIDYLFILGTPVLELFNKIKIRIFSDERVFRLDTQTHVTLTSTIPGNLRKLTTTCEDIIRIYGTDVTGSNELDVYDVDQLEKNHFWVGRTWHLNEINALYNSENESEKHIYSVSITIGYEENGLALGILCYNNLVDYFGVD